MTTATSEPDLAAFRDHLDEAAAVLDDRGDTLADLIRTGIWGPEEVARFLARFSDRPLVRACLASFVARVRGEAN